LRLLDRIFQYDTIIAAIRVAASLPQKLRNLAFFGSKIPQIQAVGRMKKGVTRNRPEMV